MRMWQNLCAAAIALVAVLGTAQWAYSLNFYCNAGSYCDGKKCGSEDCNCCRDGGLAQWICCNWAPCNECASAYVPVDKPGNPGIVPITGD
jgi:hypothetical protein